MKADIYKCACGYGWDKSKVVRHHFCPNCGRAVDSTELEPCTDAISRQAVLDVVEREQFKGDAISEIEQLPPVTPQYTEAEIQKMQDLEFAEIQKAYEIGKEEGSSEKLNRWIPVSEKLPSDGKYLVTRGDVIGRPMIGMRYFSKDLSKVDEFDFVDKKGISGWCEYDSEYGWYIDDKVTAWMPLPEPYKAEGGKE